MQVEVSRASSVSLSSWDPCVFMFSLKHAKCVQTSPSQNKKYPATYLSSNLSPENEAHYFITCNYLWMPVNNRAIYPWLDIKAIYLKPSSCSCLVIRMFICRLNEHVHAHAHTDTNPVIQIFSPGESQVSHHRNHCFLCYSTLTPQIQCAGTKMMKGLRISHMRKNWVTWVSSAWGKEDWGGIWLMFTNF